MSSADTKRLRVVLLAQGLSVAGGRSVGINIIEALGRLRPNYEYLIIVPAGVGYEDLDLPPISTVIYHDQKRGKHRRLFFDFCQLPRIVRQFQADVVWGLGNLALPFRHPFQAILFHKPQLVYPEKNNPFETSKKRMANRFLKLCIRCSLPFTDLVFCQTEVMRQRFRFAFNFNGQIEIFPNAVSEHVQEESNVVPECFSKVNYDLKLFVLTRYYAHKNLELIVDTFRIYRQELDGVCCVFTVDEHDHPRAHAFVESIRKYALENQLINVGVLPQSILSNYYYASDALLLPTLLESFSGTYLEAMRFGRPILTSDLDFARGICADAALYFDPWSPESLKNAILKIKSETQLAGQLISQGYSQLSCLTRPWSQIVEEAICTIENRFYKKFPAQQREINYYSGIDAGN